MFFYLPKKMKLLLPLLFLSACLHAQQIVHIAALPAGGNATAVVRNILEMNSGPLRIVFAKGEYHFFREEAMGRYHAITNHDNLYRYFAFPIIDRAEVEIDGGGSDFIFHEQICPFLVERSQGISLRNFSIDWEKPFYLQAEVIARDTAENSMDIRVHPMTEVVFEGSRLGFMAAGYHQLFLGESMLFDPRTRAVAYKAQDYLVNTVSSRATSDLRIADNVFRIKAKFTKEPPPVGMLFVSKGPNRFNRFCPAIHLSDSKNVELKDVVIYHAGGMGLIAEKTENIHIDKLKVMLREKSERIITTTADATHFCNCRGQLIIENCLFENMLDDAANIHGTYLRVSKLTDNRTLLAAVMHFQQLDYNFAGKDDSICFVNEATLLPIGYGKVTGFRKLNEQLYEISFDQPLPPALKAGDGIDNISWYPETIFRNNVIRNNRARGILISARNRTLIHNNSFSSMMAAILFEGDLHTWHEAGAVNHVDIRNNIFRDNAYGGRKTALIMINPRMDSISAQPYEHNIVIEQNEFHTFDNAILSALSVGGLVFSNNRIVETYTYPKLFPNSPAIEIRHCTNISIRNNSRQGELPAFIYADESSKPSLEIDAGQAGLYYQP
jgi:hypothetical protein